MVLLRECPAGCIIRRGHEAVKRSGDDGAMLAFCVIDAVVIIAGERGRISWPQGRDLPDQTGERRRIRDVV